GGRRRGLAGPVRGVGRRGRRGLPSQRRRCGWLGGGSVRWRAGHPGSSLVLSLPTPTVVFLSDKNFSRPLPFPATPCYVFVIQKRGVSKGDGAAAAYCRHHPSRKGRQECASRRSSTAPGCPC